MSDTKATRLTRETTDGGAEVATLTLANPPLNLFDRSMLAALVGDLAELSATPPRAVLLRAEGKVVSGGVDVHVFDGLLAPPPPSPSDAIPSALERGAE